MKYVSVKETDYSQFHHLMNDYYREGEDSETPQEEIDGFVQFLYDLCMKEKISGCVAFDHIPVGFVLWNIDTPNGVFSRKPGFGTILEIGINAEYRGNGLGTALAEYALTQMQGVDHYVCAYGPAESFWEKCGFCDSGDVADNGLKIYLRQSGH